ncbi:transcriptional regulator [Mizugakiibacter sediminis]|uniref:Transcriptional regulator n=1 Tax=Mizugakiibacter sediminis TaxID=1475481 RepID=A0A0K8QRL0_9GAMM|nr:YciI family protein [Mizugakiibacter sediminis]GAP67535.1 transcriptional regulator [Mizugakiibacter sediminis]
MRYLSMIRIQENTGKVPSESLMTDMGRLIEEMRREGTLIDTAGLRPTAEGKRVRLRGGRLSVMDGPFTEAKEVIGGYAVLQADSMAHAVELTKRFLALHGDGWDLECEVREMEYHEVDQTGCMPAA